MAAIKIRFLSLRFLLLASKFEDCLTNINKPMSLEYFAFEWEDGEREREC